jgi:hypothetical protein
MRLISLSATGAGTQTEEYLMTNIMTKIVTILALALCVSSAKAGIMADWVGTTAVSTGWGVASATPSTYTTTYFNANGTVGFVVTMAAGYSASSVNLAVTYTVSKLQNNQTLTVGVNGNNTTYNATTSDSSYTTTVSLSDITSGGNSSFSIAVLGNGNGIGTVTFTDVKVSGTVVPEPTNYALAGFGLLVVGGTAGRFAWRRRQQA